MAVFLLLNWTWTCSLMNVSFKKLQNVWVVIQLPMHNNMDLKREKTKKNDGEIRFFAMVSSSIDGNVMEIMSVGF
jgi:hypothetical protein